MTDPTLPMDEPDPSRSPAPGRSSAEPAAHERHGVSFREAFWVWVRVAALSFGGPAGQIAVMHRILVEETRWISETRFLHALNYCTLVPGPEAHKLAVYIGWLLHRTRGGLVVGLLFIFPGLIALGILSWIYASYGSVGYVQALFFGLKAAVLAVVLEAVVRVGRRALKTRLMILMATLSFIAIFFFSVPFPAIIIAAVLAGLVGNATGKLTPGRDRARRRHLAAGPDVAIGRALCALGVKQCRGREGPQPRAETLDQRHADPEQRGNQQRQQAAAQGQQVQQASFYGRVISL